MAAADLIAGAVARSDAIAEIAIGKDVLPDAPALLSRHFGDGPAIVVADENTFAAAGRAVAEALQAAGIAVERHVLPAVPRVKPTLELGEAIADALGEATPVAVGSGVINDLVKYAAFRRGRRYLCVPTAASMDGYASAGSPLSDAGFKKTIPCRAPRAILADLGVIASAPAEMSAWGFGDLAGKMPAAGDWILADALGIEPVDDVAWPLVQDHLPGWLAEPEAVRRGDPRAVADLFAGLTLSGLAMEFYGSSRPASGADHQIAHLWEMEELTHEGERVSHGACVAIGTLVVLTLYDWLIEQDLTRLDAAAIVERAPTMDEKVAEIHALLPARALAERARAETQAKHLSPAAHARRLEAVAAAWPHLSARLGGHMMRVREMAALLVAAGAPTAPYQIGVGPEHLRRTVLAARFIRSRYTVLDLLDECGLLGAALDATLPAPSTVA